MNSVYFKFETRLNECHMFIQHWPTLSVIVEHVTLVSATKSNIAQHRPLMLRLDSSLTTRNGQVNDFVIKKKKRSYSSVERYA